MRKPIFTLHEIIIVLTILSFSQYACRKTSTPTEQTMSIDDAFASGTDGWQPGFSDYPANLSANDSLVLYAMAYGWSPMPASIIPSRSGIRMRSANRSDDMFMFIKKKISSLSPNTEYRFSFEIEMASNAPTNAIGIGGAPAEAVILKAGASSTEPLNVRDNSGWYRINIDKGNQSVGGADMKVIGHIGVTDTTRVHAIIRRSLATPIVRKSSPTGDIWLIAATDSGFEGTTEIWWSRMRVNIQRN